MSNNKTKEDRFCLLVALMCEGSLTDGELWELSESYIPGFVTITDPVQALIIARRILPVYSEYQVVLSSIKVTRPTSYLLQIECIKTKSLDKRIASYEHILQLPIRHDLNPDIAFGKELSLVPMSVNDVAINTLRIRAMGPKASSGKAGWYLVSGFSSSDYDDGRPINCVRIPMQTAAPKLRASNGLSIESLLIMAEDQLMGLQAGPMPCKENLAALEHVTQAILVLNSRTEKRAQLSITDTQVPH